MKIQKSNNKGHGAPQIPTFIVVAFFAFLYAIPVTIISVVMTALQTFGYLKDYNSAKWSLGISAFIFIVFFLIIYLQSKGVIKSF